MKTKFKHNGMKALSCLLTVMIILSTVMVGVFTVGAVGYTGSKFAKDDYIYYDFSAPIGNGCTEVNIMDPGLMSAVEINGTAKQVSNYYSGMTLPGIIKVQLKNDITNLDQNAFQVRINNTWQGWKKLNSSTPTSGQNMIKVATDGKSFTWGVYSGSSGGDSGTSPMYSVGGGLNNNDWDNYSSSKLINTASQHGTKIFSRTVTVKGETYFNLIKSGNIKYGSANDGVDKDVSTYTYSNQYTTVSGQGDNGTALKLPSAGTYKIYVNQATDPPKVWAEVQSTATYDVVLPAKPANVSSITVTYTNSSSSTESKSATTSSQTLKVKQGTTFTVAATASSGYNINTVSFNGTIKTADTGATSCSYTFTAAAATISVTTKPAVVVQAEASKWSLDGSFNSWNIDTNRMYPTGTANEFYGNLYLTANTNYTFKIYDREASGDARFYGSKTDTSSSDPVTSISNLELSNTNVGENYNLKFKPSTSGAYKFTFNSSTKKLTVTLLTSAFTTTLTAPDSAETGVNFKVTAAVSGGSASSYKFTIYKGATTLVNQGASTSGSYTSPNTSITVDTSFSAYADAYDINGQIIGRATSADKTVRVTREPLTVTLKTSDTVTAKNVAITLTATPSKASYVSSYEFYVSSNSNFTGATKETKTTATYSKSFATSGTYYVKVVAINGVGGDNATSNVLTIEVVDNTAAHNVDIYFKSATAIAYKPTFTFDGTKLSASAVTQASVIGYSYTSSLKFVWYKVSLTGVNPSTTHTLNIKLERTSASGSITLNFYKNAYYFALDNLMSGKGTLENLTAADEYVRNYYHSPINMVIPKTIGDGTLGYTNVGGTTYQLGSIVEGSPEWSQFNTNISIMSATMVQKAAAEVSSYSALQMNLLDVNQDGRVDVKDSTLIQKALAQF